MTPDEFIEKVTARIAQEAYDYAKPGIPSQTLRNDLTIVQPDKNHASIFLTYYWALYVHDGRLPFTKTYVMRWFRDPQNDPRLVGGVTPARKADQLYLTTAEIRYWNHQNHLAELAVYGRRRRAGEPQVGPMIVTDHIRTPTQAQEFFENDVGMKGFRDHIGTIIPQMMSDYITTDALKDIWKMTVPLNVHIDTT